MRAVAPFTLGVIPLLITPTLLFHFDITPKIALLLAAAAFLLIFCICDVGAHLAQWGADPLRKSYGALLSLLLLWCAVTTVTSRHVGLSLNGSGWRLLGLIVVFALILFVLVTASWTAGSSGSLTRVLWVLSGSSACMGIYGISQYFGLDPFQNSGSYLSGEAPYTIVRPPSTAGHADFFAAAILPAVFLAPLAAHRTGRPAARVFGYAVSGVAIIAIVLSGTRAALLGLAMGALFSFFAQHRRMRRRELVLGIGTLTLAALFLASPAGARLRARIFWISDEYRGGARPLLWRDSLRMVASRPVLGFGPETFSPEFPRFQSPELASAYPDFYHESPHNIFLDAAVQSGIPGLLILLGVVALTAHAGFVLLRFEVRVGTALFAAWLALLVCSQFTSFVLTTALPFYFLSALLVALAANNVVPTGHRGAWLPHTSVRAGAVVAGVGLLVFALRLLCGDTFFQRAHKAISEGDPERAAAAYRLSRAWSSSGVCDDLFYSREMAVLARSSGVFGTRLAALQQSFEAGARAAAHAEDRHNAWYNMAELFAVRNDPAAVERSLRTAIVWAPNWFKPHWTLARLLERSNHSSEAFHEAAIANQLDGGKHPEVAQTFLHLRSLNP